MMYRAKYCEKKMKWFIVNKFRVLIHKICWVNDVEITNGHFLKDIYIFLLMTGISFSNLFIDADSVNIIRAYVG